MQFQSTLPRGERPPFNRFLRKEYGFQSTLPRGERQDRKRYKPGQAAISIHAPARGATCCMDEFKNKFEFQSTLPRGERRRVSAGKSARNYFNPRSREGSDRIPRRKDKRRLHFNPRSREGSDGRKVRRSEILRYFNPRSREGSDRP